MAKPEISEDFVASIRCELGSGPASGPRLAVCGFLGTLGRMIA